MTEFIIRPFREEDREAITQINNRDRPPHRHGTVAAWKREDQRRRPGQLDLRLCVPDPNTGQVIAFLDAADLNTTSFKMEDVCDFQIVVNHEHRSQGIGRRLYEHALDFARERGARRMITFFCEWTPQEPAIAFLQVRGFAEQERETPAFLDLTEWDATLCQSSLAQVEAYGAALFSYAEAEDTEKNRHRLYEMDKTLIYDIPRRDNQPFTFEPYEDWVKSVIECPEWRPDLCLLAAVGKDWVGKCHVVPRLELPTVGMQGMTGVLKDHRGHGFATALKARAYEKARAAGVTTVTTENHEDNAPMLAINKKFGFQAEPPMVSYNKVLDAQQDA